MCLITFGQWIKQKREEKNWTQSDFSEITGIPQTTLSGWETGKIENFLIDERLSKVAEVFSCRVCELPLEPTNEEYFNYTDHHEETHHEMKAI